MKLAVAGATGVVGKRVVQVARQRGHEVVELARSLGVDLTTGEGLAERLVGVDAVIDTANSTAQKRADAEAFFGAVTRSLLAAEQAEGVGHHVVLSIVGIDDVPLGYYQGKLLQERLVTEAGVPWSILRATQFHEFAAQVLHFVKIGPFSLVPRMLSQPIAAVEVAEALVDLAEAGPSSRAPDLAGPAPLQMVELAREVSRARGLGRRVVPVSMPGAGKAMRSGGLLPTTNGPRGRQTFEEWVSPPRR